MKKQSGSAFTLSERERQWLIDSFERLSAEMRPAVAGVMSALNRHAVPLPTASLRRIFGPRHWEYERDHQLASRLKEQP